MAVATPLPVLTAEDRALRDLARDFAHGEIAPHAARWYQEERCPVELFAKMGELDLMGLLAPEEHGGTNVSTVALVAALFEVAKIDQSIAAGWQAHLTIGSMPLIAFGSEAQKERWLRPLAAGEKLGSFGLTEPGAGSDASGIRTSAAPVDGGWVVNGTKVFISNAATEMSLGPVVLARVPSGNPSARRRPSSRAGDADDGKPGFASLLVPRGTPGFSHGPKLRGIGWLSLDSRELTFEDVALDEEHLIGEPGRGLSQFLAVLDVGRITVATLGIALAEAVLEMALEYARERRQFGRPISKFQAIQFKLADIAAQLEAVKLLVVRAAQLRDAGEPFSREGAMAKLLSSELAVKAASEAVQIHGGYGYMQEYPVSRFYRDAKVLEIGEGTNEIQRIVIARHLGC
jgi:alkylation response protein AidB-like acyl-CoA dehydrogenase